MCLPGFNLSAKLPPARLDRLPYDTYFAGFKSDPGDGYTGNNFGQDLRNFLRFLQYAGDLGAKKVWFYYG